MTTESRVLGMALGSIFFFASAFASASDELTAHYSPETMTERQHLVDAKIHPGFAELTIRRELLNGGDKPDEAQLRIELPEGAVAVGLRTRGHGPGEPWYAGKLLDSELAAAQYLELTGMGTAMLRDPALLYWLSPTSIGLQVFPCPVGQAQWVEYTVLVPTTFEDGRHILNLPPLGTEALPASWTFRPADPRDSLSTAQISLNPGASLSTLSSGAVSLLVRLEEHSPAPLSANFASTSVSDERSLVAASFVARERISDVPEGISLAIALDTSRSMGDDVLRGYERVLDALLPHYPKVRVALVAFDRVARPITDGFVTANKAKEALGSFPRSLRNGSEVTAALDAIARLFQGIPEEERRLIVLTDARERSSLDEKVVSDALRGARALTHYAEFLSDGMVLSPDSAQRHAAEVKATGGFSWVAGGSEKVDLRPIYEEWARPTRYFLRSLTLDGATVADALPEDLAEGDGFSFARLIAGNPRSAKLRADLWGKEIVLEARSESEGERRLAAFVAAKGFHSEYDLNEKEWRKLAFRARAVSPWTSYLALEPGVRPSTSGIVRDEGLGLGGIGFGSGGMTLAYGVAKKKDYDLRSHLETRIGALRRECAGEDRALTVKLETTADEIVALERVELSPADTVIERCLTERIWNEALPREARELANRTFVLAF